MPSIIDDETNHYFALRAAARSATRWACSTARILEAIVRDAMPVVDATVVPSLA